MRAVELAADLTAEHGIGLVAVGRSTHFGAAGYYARLAAERGLVAIVASNGPAHMAPHGAAEPFLGTNAFAVGAPLGRHGTFSLDMASSVAARGKVLRAQALGEPIAPGLAIDAGGVPTTDAAAALAGAVLPLGGPKGSGLAFAVCLLAGVLAGADFDDELEPMSGGGATPRPQNVGQLFLLLDPWRLASPEPRRPRASRRSSSACTASARPTATTRSCSPASAATASPPSAARTASRCRRPSSNALAAACEEGGMAALARRSAPSRRGLTGPSGRHRRAGAASRRSRISCGDRHGTGLVADLVVVVQAGRRVDLEDRAAAAPQRNARVARDDVDAGQPHADGRRRARRVCDERVADVVRQCSRCRPGRSG